MVLARLRQETAALHEEVEKQVDILSPALTVERYARILQVFQAFFEPVESALDRTCPPQYQALWEGRQRAARLRTDLATVGSAPDGTLNASAPVPDLSDPGRWLGALYVVEGSRLGGQVISRFLEKHFGWQNGQGYSFFTGDPEPTRNAWKALRDVIDADSERSNQIIAGAHQTFNQLNRCLQRSL